MNRFATLIVLATVLVGGCGIAQPAPLTVPLPTDPNPAGPSMRNVCGGVGAGVVILRGNSNDARLTWETALDGSGRQDIAWPPGYLARFVPGLEVLDPSGRVIAHDADRVPAGGCVAGPPDDPTKIVLVQPQDWSH